MSHPLQPHYSLHLRLLQGAEIHFLRFIHDLNRLVPGLAVSLAGVESDARQRLDSLHRLAGGSEPAMDSPDDLLADSCLEHVIAASSAAQRRARATEVCAILHRRLTNGFRVARAVADKIGREDDAARIDRLLATMADTFPFWSTSEPAIQPVEAARFAG